MTEPLKTAPASAEPSHTPSASATNQSVSDAQVRQVAALANLELTEDELPAMAHDLNAVLGYIAQLSELDVKDVSPMAQVSEVLDSGVLDAKVLGEPASSAHGYASNLRDDVPVPSLPREPVMAAAPETDGAFFKVPRVIER